MWIRRAIATIRGIDKLYTSEREGLLERVDLRLACLDKLFLWANIST